MRTALLLALLAAVPAFADTLSVGGHVLTDMKGITGWMSIRRCSPI